MKLSPLIIVLSFIAAPLAAQDLAAPEPEGGEVVVAEEVTDRRGGGRGRRGRQ